MFIKLNYNNFITKCPVAFEFKASIIQLQRFFQGFSRKLRENSLQINFPDQILQEFQEVDKWKGKRRLRITLKDMEIASQLENVEIDEL